LRKPKAVFLAAALLAAALFSACGGQGPGPPEATTGTTSKEPTTLETTAVETTAADEQEEDGAAAEQQYDEPSDSDCLTEQFAAATQGMGPEEVNAYETQVIDEAVQRGMDPRDVLAERGFPC